MGNRQLQLNFGGSYQALPLTTTAPRRGRSALEAMARRAINHIKANYGQHAGSRFSGHGEALRAPVKGPPGRVCGEARRYKITYSRSNNENGLNAATFNPLIQLTFLVPTTGIELVTY